MSDNKVYEWDRINRRIETRRESDRKPITVDKSITTKESIYQIERWLNCIWSYIFYLHDDFKQICEMSARGEKRIEKKLLKRINNIDDKLNKILENQENKNDR